MKLHQIAHNRHCCPRVNSNNNNANNFLKNYSCTYDIKYRHKNYIKIKKTIQYISLSNFIQFGNIYSYDFKYCSFYLKKITF